MHCHATVVKANLQTCVYPLGAPIMQAAVTVVHRMNHHHLQFPIWTHTTTLAAAAAMQVPAAASSLGLL